MTPSRLKNKIISIFVFLLVVFNVGGFSVCAEDPLVPPADGTSGTADVPPGPTSDTPAATQPPAGATTIPTTNTDATTPQAGSTPTNPITPKASVKPAPKPLKQDIVGQPPALLSTDIEAASRKSSNNLPFIVGGASLGLLGGVLIFSKTKNKNNKKDNPCQKIKDELEAKKNNLKAVTEEISLKEKIIQEFKKKAEDKKDEIKDKAVKKAKEFTKRQILKLEEESLANKTIDLVEYTTGAYGDLSDKIEQVQDLIEALRQKHQGLAAEVQKLQADYTTCMISTTGSEIFGTGKVCNPLNTKSIQITYFVHGTTTDNEKEISSGWSDVELSELGVRQSIELKDQTKNKKFDVIFCSDLKRAFNSAKLAWDGVYPIIPDARLRECNYGKLNGHPSAIVEPMQEDECIYSRFPEGESYEDVKKRIADFLEFLKKNYKGKSIAIVAHKAPQLSLDVLLKGKTWKKALAEDWRKTKSWQPGWEYNLN